MQRDRDQVDEKEAESGPVKLHDDGNWQSRHPDSEADSYRDNDVDNLFQIDDFGLWPLENAEEPLSN